MSLEGFLYIGNQKSYVLVLKHGVQQGSLIVFVDIEWHVHHHLQQRRCVYVLSFQHYEYVSNYDHHI